MFTLEQMKAAHAKVKSGADFPAYAQEIKQLGLLYYEFQVKDGRIIYFGATGFQVSGLPIYKAQIIAVNASPEVVQQIIYDHQQGKSDFLTFCEQVAKAGVEKWVVDTRSMMCSYFDLMGNVTVSEPIPDKTY